MQPEQIVVKKYNGQKRGNEFPLRQFPPRFPRKKKFEIIQDEYDEIQKNEVNWDVFVKARWSMVQDTTGKEVVYDHVPCCIR